MIAQQLEKNYDMQYIKEFRAAISELMQNRSSIVYAVYDSGLIVLYLNITGPRAKQEAGALAANWWRSIRSYLIHDFYYEVAVTWMDEEENVYKEVRTSHNFPHKAGNIKAHQISFPEPPKGTLRQT